MHKAIRPFLLVAAVSMGALKAKAVVIPLGFFQGNDIIPTASAPLDLLQKKQAAVMIFSADARSVEATKSFNNWSNTSKYPTLTKYAVAVAESNVPVEVMEEVARQRELSLPVFITHGELLMEQSFRIVFLEDGHAVETMTDATPASLDLAAARVLGHPPEPPVPQTAPPPAQGQATPLPTATAPEQHVLTRLGEAAGTTVSIDVEPTPTPETVAGLYENTQFGMSVQFPHGWGYEEATSGDGAVAIPPTGVQLDLRIWATPTDQIDSPASAFAYIEKSLEALSRKYRSRVTVEQRLTVEADGFTGADITYTYARPLTPGAPAGGGLRQLGRIQVFAKDGFIKAMSAEGSSGEFSALRPIIDPCFDTFTAALTSNE